jgi:hypothetical protein
MISLWRGDETLEQADVKEPDLQLILNELRQAQGDATNYYNKLEHARMWWRSEWKGITTDGRMHSDEMGEVFPWDNAYDSRTRVVQTLIREHVNYALYIFWNAKIQVRSMRPLVQGREKSVAQRLLEWRIYTHMQSELMRELALYFGWRYGYGLSLMWIEWEQQRLTQNVDINLATLDDLLTQGRAQQGQSVMPELIDLFADEQRTPEAEQLIKSLSPDVSNGEVKKLVKDLRVLRFGKLPVSWPYINKPKWTALRPAIDVLFPSQESNIQAARFISLRELVTESELTDRIITRNYDPDFVEEAIKHKGEFADWMQQTQWKYTASDSDRDMIELHHFHYKNISENQTPRIYKTVFNEASIGSHNLFATHGMLDYDHAQYPCVIGRRTYEHRPILSSQGIAEEAYTDEINIKCQLDGIGNRTDIVLAPPLIVPSTRVDAVRGTFGPREVMGVNRPNEMQWMPLPPFDNTPVEVIRLVQERLDRRYPLYNRELPELAQIYRQQQGKEVLNEIELIVEQTFQLMQQFEAPQETTQVVGTLQRPFHMDPREIQGKYEIVATIDYRQLDEEYAQKKLDLIGKAMAFKESNLMFRLALEAIDPDAADVIQQDQTSPSAQEKEKRQVHEDMSQMMNGIMPPYPMMANHQLHLQTIQQILSQPNMTQRLQGLPDSQKLIQARVKFHQAQITQHQVNPTVGRALATNTMQPQQSPELEYASPRQ